MPATIETIEVVREFTTNDGSAICLVKLGSLAALLTWLIHDGSDFGLAGVA
jgi:hypothetical protein